MPYTLPGPTTWILRQLIMAFCVKISVSTLSPEFTRKKVSRVEVENSHVKEGDQGCDTYFAATYGRSACEVWVEG